MPKSPAAGTRGPIRRARARPTRPAPTSEFSLAATARRIAGATNREAGRISIEPEASPERLHRFHQRLRRLRTAIRLAARLLSGAQSAAALELHRRLRRVARLVGEVRDFDVAIAHLSDPRLSSAARPPAGALATRLGRMREEARTGRALLGAFLRSEIDRGLFLEAEEILTSAAPRLGGTKAWNACRDALARARARIERALKRARRRPDRDRMHRLRMELRRAHLLSDLLDAAVGRGETRFPGRLNRLQRALGALHDLDLLIGGLEDVGLEEEDSPWFRHEETRRRLLRKELLAQVRKRSTREAIARLSP